MVKRKGSDNDFFYFKPHFVVLNQNWLALVYSRISSQYDLCFSMNSDVLIEMILTCIL